MEQKKFIEGSCIHDINTWKKPFLAVAYFLKFVRRFSSDREKKCNTLWSL